MPIGAQYVTPEHRAQGQPKHRKTLAFLDVQLPLFKRQLEQSEEAYNRYRNQKGTVAFTEEATLILSTAVDRQTKLLEAQQRRRELEARFTANHPLRADRFGRRRSLPCSADIGRDPDADPRVCPRDSSRKRCAWSATSG